MAIESFLDFQPVIPESAFVAASADVIGRVTLGEESSVWYNATLRGDINEITIGPRSNVCLLYTSPSPRDLSTSRMPSSA